MTGDRTLYRRVARGKSVRYEPVGWECESCMPPGVYMVHKPEPGVTRTVVLARVADMPDPMPAAALWQHIDAITAACRRSMDRWVGGTPMSANDFAQEILQEVQARLDDCEGTREASGER